MQNIGNKILQKDELVKLIQEENFVGYIYKIDYDTAQVMTNDLWKEKVLGIPHNCFLVAAEFNPNKLNKDSLKDIEIILLRVIGSAKLPLDDDLIKTKIDKFQNQQDKYHDNIQNLNTQNLTNGYDDITLNQIQFHGLECSILGTFYQRDNFLWLGSDLESFVSSTKFNVYRPRDKALETIVNYVDPIRRNKAREDMKELGIRGEIYSFPIGTVRYTSTDRLHRQNEEEKVQFSIQPTDFLARRTAVFGMTRTGKSNMVKQTVSVVKKVADKGGIKIGQIIYDINGEYANANQQDKGALADIYSNDTVRYRMLKTEGFEELQNNFYIQLNEGFSIIKQKIIENKNNSQEDVQVFLNTSFDEPEKQDQSNYNRWQVRVATYKALLYKSGFPILSNNKVYFEANQEVRDKIAELVILKIGNSIQEQDPKNIKILEKIKKNPHNFLLEPKIDKSSKKLCEGNNIEDWTFKNPKNGLTLDEAVEWFLVAREANGGKNNNLKSSSGKDWFDNDTRAILNLLAKSNDNDAYIKGYSILSDAKKYHSSRRSQEVGNEIYQHLIDGKILIIDLSVGEVELREKISKQIASDIFQKSMNIFIEGKSPPNIVIYIEEAHNLIGKGMDLTETWPRIAKEGAKYGIALVYSTQEVSSVHPSILKASENWFVTHLNNEIEIRELAKYYDFADFSRSLLRAQDVGFARVKTLSSPFVVPVQIDKFNPELKKSKNQKAIEVLDSFVEQGDAQEQKETWEAIKPNLMDNEDFPF